MYVLVSFKIKEHYLREWDLFNAAKKVRENNKQLSILGITRNQAFKKLP